MSNTNRRIQWVRLIGAIPIAAFVIFLGYQFIVQLPKAKQAQAQLENEFNAISPLPNANAVKHDASHKTNLALVETTYLTDVSRDDIFKYYDEQLKQHGWQYYNTTGLTDWGKDLGGKSAEYCKDDYVASIQYAGEQAQYGWTYAFNMSWRLGGCGKR
jgi:hypothetical protein